MTKIDSAYQYYLSTYGDKLTGSRYDTHKKSELRSVYNRILKANKESPLFKITQTGDVAKFAIDIKEHARDMQKIVASLSMEGDDISSILKKKVAISSDENAVTVEYVGDDDSADASSFTMEVKKLATPQINTGNFLNSNGHSFEAGTFSFDLDTTANSYEFQFNVNPGDTNYDVQSKIARLVNQSDVGLNAEVITNEQGQSALSLASKQTGLAENEEYLFRIQSGSSWSELNTLGIHNITSPASNSQFTLNGTEHSSLSNTFTINKAFEITLQSPTTDGPATIGFKTDTNAVADGVSQLLDAYNGMIAVGMQYSSAHSNNLLLNDVTAIGRNMTQALASVGIYADSQGMLSMDRDLLAEAITGDRAKENYAHLTHLKDSMSRRADSIAINPMNYVNKIVVEYKNPGKNFGTPYVPSAYAGMLLDQAL